MKNFSFKINENSYSVKILSQENNTIELEVNGTGYSVKMKEDISVKKTPTLVRRPSGVVPTEPVKMKPSSTSNDKITAPLPGVVMALKVKVGDTVKPNDVLLVLEAMKMENNIVCERGGVVKTIHIQQGQQVLQGDVMIEIE